MSEPFKQPGMKIESLTPRTAFRMPFGADSRGALVSVESNQQNRAKAIEG